MKYKKISYTKKLSEVLFFLDILKLFLHITNNLKTKIFQLIPKIAPEMWNFVCR